MAPRSADVVSSELVIPANKPIAFHYLAQQRYARQCFNTLSFVPRPGVDYQLQATMAGGCRIELDERRAGEEWLQIVDATQTAKASMCNVMDNF